MQGQAQDRTLGSAPSPCLVLPHPASPSFSWEPCIFWGLVLGSAVPRRKGIPSPPSVGKSPTSPRQQPCSFFLLFSFSLSLLDSIPGWVHSFGKRGFYHKSLHSPHRRGVMGLRAELTPERREQGGFSLLRLQTMQGCSLGGPGWDGDPFPPRPPQVPIPFPQGPVGTVRALPAANGSIPTGTGPGLALGTPGLTEQPSGFTSSCWDP